MLNKYKKFLIVVAHPDDETLGCGGTIYKLSKLGKKIKVVFIAEGSSCRFKNHQKNKNKILKVINQRTNMAIKALKKLGVKNYTFYNLECGKLNSLPITKISNLVEKEIEKFKPEILITHSDFDVNMDHRTIFQACLQSSRPTKKENKIKGLLSFEILSSTEWKYSKIFEPNFFINIEKEINAKINALKIYSSEIKNFPHPRSVDGLKSLAKYRGVQSFNSYAEAFKIVRLFSK